MIYIFYGGVKMNPDTKHIIKGAFFVALGALIALGPQFLFRICEQTHGHEGVTKCWWSAQAEIGVGAVIALLGFLCILIRETHASIGLSLAIALNGILAFLIPNVLTGMCEHPHMNCRLTTLPALNILSVVTVLAAAADAARLFKKSRRAGSVDAAAQAKRA
jgi:hypothetical protein